MSPAVIKYTLARLISGPNPLLNLFLLAAGGPLLVVLMLSQVMTDPVYMFLAELFKGPTIPLLVAFVMISDTVAKNYSVKEGESLTLLFCRPISRCTYIVSKWFAGAIGVSVVVLTQCLVIQSALTLLGHKFVFIDWEIAASIVLNSFSYAALVVFVHTFPARWGLALFFILLYVSMFASMHVQWMADRPNAGVVIDSLYLIIGVSCDLLGNFVLPRIDVHQLLHSVKLPVLSVVSYLSNIALYIYLSTLVINRRDYYYAAE